MMLNRAYFDEELLKQIFLPRKVFNCILFSQLSTNYALCLTSGSVGTSILMGS